MKPRSRKSQSVIVLVALAASLSAARAQTATTAMLRGRILDDAGTGIPGVVVTLTNPGIAIGSQHSVTDLEGNYAFKLLPPGAGYSVKAALPGYATVVAGPIDLNPTRTTQVNLSLRPSSELQETVEVEAQGDIVDTESTVTSSSYGAEFLEGLPLLGRRFNDVLTLAPGVTDTDGDGNPNVHGARDTGLQLRLDGTNTTDPLSGHFGQDINLETVEEIEVITSGAPAEYSRADGGFANIITKSGGNAFEGSFKYFLRSSFLDGDGANNEDQTQISTPVEEYKDTQIYLTLGGALVRDHLWYFGSVQRVDREVPVNFAAGGSGLTTQEGWNTFGKITWQTDPDNKLTFQINYDPFEYTGNYQGPYISPDSDYIARTGGPLPQVKWTSIISPRLLIESLVSRLDAGVQISPASDDFRQIEIITQRNALGQIYARLPCASMNCANDASMFRLIRGDRLVKDLYTPTRSVGPYPFVSNDSRERATFKTDLSLTIDDWHGSHSIKGGFEFNDERYSDRPINNPIMTDNTVNSTQLDVIIDPPPPPHIRYGTLTLEAYDPPQDVLRADGLAAGFYAQDSWKPMANLTVNIGLRVDSEELDSTGFSFFEPANEARQVLRRFDVLCNAQGSACTAQRSPGRIDRGLTGIVVAPPGSPQAEFDLNHDGLVEVAGPEGNQVRAPLTTGSERLSEGFSISNTNLAPRLSVSWDPWADGRTKFFGTWNKYYDRLFLGAITAEQGGNLYNAQWVINGPGQQAEPGGPSKPINGLVTANQVDRDLETPSTIEWSIGVERELAAEWAVNATFISRRGDNLLQDKDVNHITCTGFDDVYGVSPRLVCGDGGGLEMDRFGGDPTSGVPDPNRPGVTPGAGVPNGAPDLYVLNSNWNQILRVGNYNASTYTALELTIRKRLHRNWQMQASYTWSEARGDAESFTGLAGNDPAVSDLAAGYLDFDQRHVLKWQGVTHLPHGLILGGTLQWSSGLPYSIVSTTADRDDAGTLSASRTFFPTGEKNDQRNRGVWLVGGRIEKSMVLRSVNLSAFLSGENLLNNDALNWTSVQSGLRSSYDGTRLFGRRWEIGAAVQF